MKPSRAPRHTLTQRPAHTKTARLIFAALAAPLLCANARAQGPTDPNAAYRQIMQHRMEQSQRSVEETERRRFEDGKTSDPFPSDANKAAAKPGTVRAVPPEEQKALAHNERGLDYFSRGKLDQAVKEYDEAIRLYPTLAPAHNNRGSALFALSRFDAAAASFNKAIELEPNYGQARFNLALALIKLGREREANDALMAATRAYLASGDAHIKAGELDAAEADFKGLLQIDPDYPPAHLKLGLLYDATRRFDEAVRSLTLVTAKQPDNADAFEGLGEAYAGLHKFDESLNASERALKLQTDLPGAHYFAGVAAASLGRRDQALAHLDKLKQLHADDYAKLLADFIDKKAPAKQ
jgi:tetratricopeptide (TPR) repeat protein